MAKFCVQCGTALDEDSEFCYKCGAPVRKKRAVAQKPILLDDVCPACGKKLKPRAEFCASCGLKIVADQEMTPEDVKSLYEAHLISVEDYYKMLYELSLKTQ